MTVTITLLLGILFGGAVVFLASLDLWKRPLTQQNNHLRQQVARLAAAEQDLRQRLRVATFREATAVRQQKVEQQAQQKLHKQMADLRGRYELLQEQLRDIKTHNRELSKRLADEADKMSELHMGLAGAKTQYQNQQTIINELKAERQLLQSQLADDKGEQAITKQQLAVLQQKNGALEAELKQAQHEREQMEALRTEIKLQQARLDELKDQLHHGRAEQERLVDRLTNASKLFGSIETQYEAAQQKLVDLPHLHERNKTLQQQLEELTDHAAELRQKLNLHERDNLREIHGIGNIFAARLQAAGVDSYAKLAEKTPEELREIIKVKPWQAINTAEWIVEAKHRLTENKQS